MRSPRILVVDDDALHRWGVRNHLSEWGYNVDEAESRPAALDAFRSGSPDLILLDLRLGAESGLDVLRDLHEIDPDAAVIMISGQAEFEDAVEGFRLGLVDFFTKPVDFSALRVAIRYRLEARRLESEVRRSRTTDGPRERYGIIGDSEEIREALRLVEKVAANDSTTVLLQGESGTGKDVFAKAIHQASPRRDQPFLAVNCAALPDALLETELFGHERGAFTDARMLKRGVFELADGGTLYLDEIGELKLPLQAKLLRVLEDFSFRRVGGVQDITVDTRVIAASNRSLREMVAEGAFRADLFYRLSIIQIELPPLRERLEDIPRLVNHFVDLLAGKLRRSISRVTPQAMRVLEVYHWPGNVRELRNVLERAIILEDGDEITTKYLSMGPAADTGTAPGGSDLGVLVKLPVAGVSLEKVEEELLRQAMVLSAGNQTRAAKLLDISRDALRYKLKKFGIGVREGDIAEPDPS
jgi:DNA-binding NtrC family response regulator